MITTTDGQASLCTYSVAKIVSFDHPEVVNLSIAHREDEPAICQRSSETLKDSDRICDACASAYVV